MNNTKINFISDLLADKRVSASDKERIFSLAKNTFEIYDTKFDTIVRRLEKLEGGEIREKSENKLKEDISKSTKKIANPKHVADFMNLFNQRNGLKYLTHDYDEEGDFNIDVFLKDAETIFKNKTKELSIPQSLWAIVNKFAFTDNPVWISISKGFEKHIKEKIGWSSPEWKDWSKKNQLHPIRNEEYKKVINDFRRITRIEKEQLGILIDNAIDNIFKDKKEEFEFELIDLQKADFYTHVMNLKEALESVFEEIKERTNNDNQKKVTIKYLRDSEDDYFVRKIEITHHNSYPSKELNVLLQEWLSLEKGNMGKIAKKLQGYCYWSVKTNIENTPVKINILKDENTLEHEHISQEEVLGFTHEFTFYYK